jgi:hypothetical protein
MLLSKMKLQNKRISTKYNLVKDFTKDGIEVLMTLGAGDVSSLGPIIIDGLSKRFANN